MKATMLVVCLVACAACSRIQSAAVRTGPAVAPNMGAVSVTAMTVPPGATQLGIVTVRGHGSIEDLAPLFRARVAELGGNHGVIERVSVQFDAQTVWVSEMYPCGYRGAANCTRMVPRTDEYSSLEMTGRAYLVATHQ